MKFKISENSSIELALKKLSKLAIKCLIVEDDLKKFKGILTDGDIRREIIFNSDIKQKIKNIYNNKPFYILNGKKKNFNNKKKSQIDFIPIINNKKKFIKFKILKKKNFFKKNKKIISDVPVVIMAGGKGNRLRPFTKYIPKPLVPINNKNLLENLIHFSVKNGFKKFFITVNYMKNKIIRFIKINNYLKYFSIIHEKKPLGTASSLRYFLNKKFKNIIVLNCDILFNFNILKVLNFHLKKKSDITVVGSQKKIKLNYGVLKIINKINILKINEKPTYDNFISAGFYIINKTTLKFIKRNQKFNMNDLISTSIKNNKKVLFFKIKNRDWIDFGNWKNFKKFENELKEKKWVKKY